MSDQPSILTTEEAHATLPAVFDEGRALRTLLPVTAYHARLQSTGQRCVQTLINLTVLSDTSSLSHRDTRRGLICDARSARSRTLRTRAGVTTSSVEENGAVIQALVMTHTLAGLSEQSLLTRHASVIHLPRPTGCAAPCTRTGCSISLW